MINTPYAVASLLHQIMHLDDDNNNNSSSEQVNIKSRLSDCMFGILMTPKLKKLIATRRYNFFVASETRCESLLYVSISPPRA